MSSVLRGLRIGVKRLLPCPHLRLRAVRLRIIGRHFRVYALKLGRGVVRWDERMKLLEKGEEAEDPKSLCHSDRLDQSLYAFN